MKAKYLPQANVKINTLLNYLSVLLYFLIKQRFKGRYSLIGAFIKSFFRAETTKMLLSLAAGGRIDARRRKTVSF